MEDDYIVCVKNDTDPASMHYLEVGNKYHVEEAFNITPENNMWNDPEGIADMLKEFPNPYFYLKEVHETCGCCGERQYFWHGLFITKKQFEEDANLEKITQESGSQS